MFLLLRTSLNVNPRASKQLYDEYIREGAAKQVNLSGSTVASILAKITSADESSANEIGKTLFAEAKNEIRLLLSSDSFLTYRTSPYYELRLVGNLLCYW